MPSARSVLGIGRRYRMVVATEKMLYSHWLLTHPRLHLPIEQSVTRSQQTYIFDPLRLTYLVLILCYNNVYGSYPLEQNYIYGDDTCKRSMKRLTAAQDM